MTDMRILNLKTGGLTAPLGIEIVDVSWSWQMVSGRVGAAQKAYRLELFDDQGRLLQRTERIDGEFSTGIQCPFPLMPGSCYGWRVAVLDEQGFWTYSQTAEFETAISSDQKWQQLPFCVPKQESEVLPVFSYCRRLPDDVVKARIYLAVLGVSEVYLNGERLGDEAAGERAVFLNPGYGNGRLSQNYLTCDISGYLQNETDLRLTCGVGKGWFWGMDSGSYRPALKFLVRFFTSSGEMIQWTSDDERVRLSYNSCIRKNSIYDGEQIDGAWPSLQQLNTGGSSEISDGEPAYLETYEVRLVSRPALRGYVLWSELLEPTTVTIYTGSSANDSYPGGTIKEKMRMEKTATVKNLQYQELLPGETMVVDFGQNTTAVPHVVFSLQEAGEVRLRFSEMLNDGRLWDDDPYSRTGDGPRGSLYTKNYRREGSRVLYKSQGDVREEYRPATTFFGYRYMEITATAPMKITSLLSIPLSSVYERTGRLVTNNQDVNRLIENCCWSQSSNYFTTATDCPQRDERSFWSGDTQVFCQTGLFNFDCAAFIGSLQQVMVESTDKKGYCPMVVDQTDEEYFSTFCAGWSDALVIVAWTLYLQSGDRLQLKRSWKTICRYLEFLETNERMPDAAPLFGERNCGDWLAFQGTCVAMMADYYYLYTLKLAGKIAAVLKETAEEKRWSQKQQRIRERFYQNHIKFNDLEPILCSGDRSSWQYQFHAPEGKSGVWEDDSQTALLWYLQLDLCRNEAERQKICEKLAANIKNHAPKPTSIRAKQAERTLSVGFLGVNVLAPVLSENGMAELAYDLLLQDQLPSWLFEVKNGGTTIWERWNSYDPDEGFGLSEMNSFNHYAYGAIVEWLYRYVLGISWSETAAGFKHIRLAPHFDTGAAYNTQRRIGAVSGTYDSPYGPIAVSWETTESRLRHYKVRLPANTTAELFLPGAVLPEDDNLPAGVVLEGLENGRQHFSLAAGHWRFSVNNGHLTVENGASKG